MIQPTRHPQDDLILDYARGGLGAGHALVIAAHLGACAACRGAVRLAEAVGGALLAETPPAELAPDALANALSRLDLLPPPPATPPPRSPDTWIGLPEDVLIAAERARRPAAPGVWVAHVTGVPGEPGPHGYLLGLGPRIAVPQHTHAGREFVCVVAGAYRDRGQVYLPGDFVENDAEVEHQPRVTRDGECVCLIAADDLLVPRSVPAQLLRAMIGI